MTPAPFDPTEAMILVLSACLVAFGISHRRELRAIPHATWLVTSVSLLLAAWLVSVGQGLAWPVFLNRLAHVLYVASSIALATWCAKQGAERAGR